MTSAHELAARARLLLFPPSAGLYRYSRNLQRASLVAVHDAGYIDDEQAARLAAGIDSVESDENAENAENAQAWNDYLDFEARLEAKLGPDASLIHLGRSRQDIFSTIVQARLRDTSLRIIDVVLELRAAVIELAKQHVTTVVPSYTHGVQAQPTAFAHQLLAFEEALSRSVDRLVNAFERASEGPLGAGAMTTSGFRLDRELLARLLGFARVSRNAFGANHVAVQDVALEVGSAISITMMQVVQFVQDIFAVQTLAQPWVRLRVGELTGVSSMMPQKRNPSALESVRELAAASIGRSGALFASAINLPSGMPDLRETSIAQLPIDEAVTAIELTRAVVEELEVRPDWALAECRRDYSTMTELADLLYATSRVPFRTGHEFASALTDYGRARGLAPAELGYETAARVYLDVVGAVLPLTAEEFGLAVDPAHFVQSRAGMGGPQRAEVELELSTRDAALNGHRGWSADSHRRLRESAAELVARFAQLRSDGHETVDARTSSLGENNTWGA